MTKKPIRHITLKEFKSENNIIENPANEQNNLFLISEEEMEIVYAQPHDQVWTLMSGDDHIWLVSGFFRTNRLGYVLTDNPHDYLTEVKICTWHNETITDTLEI